MLPEDEIRLQHMLDAARKAVRLAVGRNRRVLEDEDDPLADALVHLISVIGEAAKYVAKENIIASTNCGMAPMRRDIAFAKLAALGQGAALARKKFG